MTITKRALLIASPYGGLRGPVNDVDAIALVLEKCGFEITRCSGDDATREGIRTAWRHLISQTNQDDAVFLYYSGHGGLVEAPGGRQASGHEEEQKQPWRYQFIVPMDYHKSTDEDFRGILDIEISHLLRDTTNKSMNVTVVLDCCHSGRMFRDPTHGDKARPKTLQNVQHHDISKYLKRLRDQGELVGETFLDGNPYAVRIVAAAADEVAWELDDKNGVSNGVFTNALVRAIDAAKLNELSWRTTLYRVTELVNAKFPQQHPQVEGPGTRLPFSMQEIVSGGLPIRVENEVAIIGAGRVAGVREGNVYSIMPFGSEVVDHTREIATATVTRVIAFEAKVKLQFTAPNHEIPDGALCFLYYEALKKWPVRLSQDLQEFRNIIDESKFLRYYDVNTNDICLAEIQQKDKSLVLYNNSHLSIASRQMNDCTELTRRRGLQELVKNAETLARAQHLLTLKCEKPAEKLCHHLEVEWGLVQDEKKGRKIQLDGSGYVTEQDKIYITLQNRGEEKIYVSVFNVNAMGNTTLLNGSSHPKGIELPGFRSETLGEDQRWGDMKGLKVSWPESVPKGRPIGEQFVLVASSDPVDLQFFSQQPDASKCKGSLQDNLSQLAYQIACGGLRCVARDGDTHIVQYDIIQIPYSLHPLILEPQERSVVNGPHLASNHSSSETITGQEGLPSHPSGESEHSAPENSEGHEGFSSHPPDGDTLENITRLASELPEPEETGQHEVLPLPPQPLDGTPKGIFGRVNRYVRGIPSCVWVVNKHVEEITVVVSKYAPERMLTGGGVNVAPTGAGINYTATTFTGPATKKTLAPHSENPKSSKATFPLWTRHDGFGVISIFKGSDRILYIENDKIRAGATAYFCGTPDLEITDYKSGQDE